VSNEYNVDVVKLQSEMNRMKNEITIKTRVSETVQHFIKHGHTLENVHPFIFLRQVKEHCRKHLNPNLQTIRACSSKAMKETLNESATDRLRKIYQNAQVSI